MDRSTLERKPLAELREIASTLELRGYQRMRKADLVDLIVNVGDGPGNGNGSPAGEASAQPSTSDDTDDSDDGQGRTRARTRARTTDDGDTDDQSGGDGDGASRTRTRADTDDQSEGDGDGASRTRTRARRRDDDDGRADRSDDGGEDGRDGGGDGQDQRSRQDRQDGQDRQERGRGRDTDDDEDDDDSDDGGDDGGRNRNRNRNRSRNRNKRNRNKGKGGGGGQDNLEDAEVREGVLDLLPEGYGFLRCTGYLTGSKDVYVSQSFVRRYNLRRGDRVQGPIRQNKGNDKFPALGRVDEVDGVPIDQHNNQRRVEFKDLTPLFPKERLRLETPERSPIAMRLVDMMSPIGKGQRGLIVSPPKAGKTTILKQLAHAIESNNPETHLMVLLVDERPEEVTDFERSTSGEVISSTFDRPAEDHTQVAELCIERAKRLVERGRDVVILLDSITRLGRAYNLAAPASGRILSGGIDSAALYPPKRFFGAARNIEEGGSLTIIATALVETGSKMDEVIFEEFKGTGNMELRLDRKMEQKRIFPAIDVQSSGTRREELLLERGELETVWKLRRVLSQMDGGAALELLIDKLKTTKTNEQFLAAIAKSNLA